MITLPPKVSRGDEITASWANKVVSAITSLRPMAGAGTRISQTPGGFIVSANFGSVASVSVFPFQCTLIPQTNPDGTPAGNKVAVEYNSTLYQSLVPLTEFSGITGLYDPDPTSSGYPVYLDLDGPNDTKDYTSPDGKPDDYVFLEIHFDSDGFSISSASIETKGNGSTADPTLAAWSTDDALLVDNGATPPVISVARIVLASYQDGKLTQNVMENLVLADMVIDGQLAYYPVPY